MVLMQKNARVVKIDGYEHVPPFNEDALKKAVTHQPVSVAIEATGRDFQLYHSVISLYYLPNTYNVIIERYIYYVRSHGITGKIKEEKNI